MAQIEVTGLVKDYRRLKTEKGLRGALKSLFHPRYETLRAVDDVAFAIEPGEMVGYIGPNGSGKSTTIKMLCGILRPTAGSVRVNGLDPFADRLKNNKHIGVVFGQRSTLFWDVPVTESFRLLQRLYEVEDDRFAQNLAMLTDTLDLADLLGVPERQLSLGQKMRCNLAAAFLHDPTVVFLDEPTIGVDYQSKQKIRAMIRRLNAERGTTFIITSHDFADIEELSRRIILIDKGRMVVDTPADAMRRAFGRTRTMHLQLTGGGEAAARVLEEQGLAVASATDTEVVLTYETARTSAVQVISLLSGQADVVDITVNEPPIESIVAELLADNHRTA